MTAPFASACDLGAIAIDVQLGDYDTPLSDAAFTEDGISSAEYAVKHADVVEGVIVQDSRVDRGQIDGTPEDGESFFGVD